MKKEKKMLAIYRRAQEIMLNSAELSEKLTTLIVEKTHGEDAAMVALYSLAKTVVRVVGAQMESGDADAMDRFITLLGSEIQAKVMMKSIN